MNEYKIVLKVVSKSKPARILKRVVSAWIKAVGVFCFIAIVGFSWLWFPVFLCRIMNVNPNICLVVGMIMLVSGLITMEVIADMKRKGEL